MDWYSDYHCKVRAVLKCVLADVQPKAHEKREAELRKLLVFRRFKCLKILCDRKFAACEKAEYDKLKVVHLFVEYLNFCSETTGEIKENIDRLKVWQMEPSEADLGLCLQKAYSNSAFLALYVIFDIGSDKHSHKTREAFIARWLERIERSNAATFYLFFATCLDWVIENRNNRSHGKRVRVLLDRYFCAKNRITIHRLLSANDIALLDSLHSTPALPAYDILDRSAGTFCYQFAQPKNSYSKLCYHESRFSFDFLDENSQLLKRMHFRHQRDPRALRWTREESEMNMRGDLVRGLKVYHLDLPLVSLGRVSVSFLNNHITLQRMWDKKLCHDLSLSAPEVVKCVWKCLGCENFICAQIQKLNSRYILLYSVKSRKIVAKIVSKTPNTVYHSSESLRYIKQTNERYLLCTSSAQHSIDVYSINRRTYMGTYKTRDFINFERAYFFGDTMICNEGSRFTVSRLSIIPKTGSVELRSQFDLPNLIDKSCWWNRSIVTHKQSQYRYIAPALVLVVSLAADKGLQVLDLAAKRTFFVKLFDSDTIVQEVKAFDGKARYYAHVDELNRMSLGEINIQQLALLK